MSHTPMTQAEVLAEMGSESLLNKVRRLVSNAIGHAQQAEGQRRPPTIWDVRRAEFTAARQLIALVSSQHEAENATLRAERDELLARVNAAADALDGYYELGDAADSKARHKLMLVLDRQLCIARARREPTTPQADVDEQRAEVG